jgi:hypothetical protein
MTGFPDVLSFKPIPTAFNLSGAGLMVGTVAEQLSPPLTGSLAGVSFYRLYNSSPDGGPSLWYSRLLGQAVAPNAPGALRLRPGESETFIFPQAIPSNAVWGVADGSGCAVTVEFG